MKRRQGLLAGCNEVLLLILVALWLLARLSLDAFDLVEGLVELGELSRLGHKTTLHHERSHNLLVLFAAKEVETVGDESLVEVETIVGEEVASVTSNFGAALLVDHLETVHNFMVRQDVGAMLRLDVGSVGVPNAQFGVVVFGLRNRHRVMHQVSNGSSKLLELDFLLRFNNLEVGNSLVERGLFFDQTCCLIVLLLFFEQSDSLLQCVELSGFLGSDVVGCSTARASFSRSKDVLNRNLSQTAFSPCTQLLYRSMTLSTSLGLDQIAQRSAKAVLSDLARQTHSEPRFSSDLRTSSGFPPFS